MSASIVDAAYDVRRREEEVAAAGGAAATFLVCVDATGVVHVFAFGYFIVMRLQLDGCGGGGGGGNVWTNLAMSANLHSVVAVGGGGAGGETQVRMATACSTLLRTRQCEISFLAHCFNAFHRIQLQFEATVCVLCLCAGGFTRYLFLFTYAHFGLFSH